METLRARQRANAAQLEASSVEIYQFEHRPEPVALIVVVIGMLFIDLITFTFR